MALQETTFLNARHIPADVVKNPDPKDVFRGYRSGPQVWLHKEKPVEIIKEYRQTVSCFGDIIGELVLRPGNVVVMTQYGGLNDLARLKFIQTV